MTSPRQHRWLWCAVEYLQSGYIEGKGVLVGADDKLREEFIGQTIKVTSVEFGIGTSLKVGFYSWSVRMDEDLSDMAAYRAL